MPRPKKGIPLSTTEQIEEATKELSLLYCQKSEIEGKIREKKSVIAGLNEQLRRENLDKIADLAAANGVSVKEVLAAFSDPAFVALIPKEGEKKQESPTPLSAPSVGINGQNSTSSLPQISPIGGSVR